MRCIELQQYAVILHNFGQLEYLDWSTIALGWSYTAHNGLSDLISGTSAGFLLSFFSYCSGLCLRNCGPLIQWPFISFTVMPRL